MLEIRNLLERFETILSSEESRKAAVRQAISETLGVDIASEAISIRNNTVYLDAKPLYKNEIFLKHEQITQRIGELLLGKNPPRDIR